MSQKIPMKDMVVILPGILGSVLQKDGKDLWAVSGQAIWQVLADSNEAIQHLKLVQDDPEAESLGDGIRATRLVEDAHLIPGLVKIDGYTKVARLITDNIVQERGQNGLAFHREIEATVTANLKDEVYKNSFTKVPIDRNCEPTSR
ncbi:hypothetical protein [Microcoleus sp. S13_C5]|uniref:hypothetical protein n=1 Tax=Microcoleus sp. S13_C5 TaxID=3055411 RepID=UPI002FCEAD61